MLAPLPGLGNSESATEYEDFSAIDIFWYCSGARMKTSATTRVEFYANFSSPIKVVQNVVNRFVPDL